MEPLTCNEAKTEPRHVNKGNLYEFVPKDIYKPVYYYCLVTQDGLCAASLMDCDPPSRTILSLFLTPFLQAFSALFLLRLNE